jgi:hypothetical protein
MALQTRRIVEGAQKVEAQYFGAIEGKGVMVGPIGSEGTQTGLSPGDVCIVRGFTGQYEFSFLSKVLQNFDKPFVYALLAYPAQADARLVRKSMRTKASWPATLTPVAKPDAPATGPVQGALVDISMSGAMVKALGSPGIVGATVNMKLSVTIDQAPTEIYLSASICHNNRATYEEGHYFIGLSFRDLTTQDKLVLNYLTQNGPG